MGSRLRSDPNRIYEVFAEVSAPSDSNLDAFILQQFPEDFADTEVLKNLCKFAFPCDIDSQTVQQFSFVLTDAESKYTFGFCRHAPQTRTCSVVLSFLPWHEFFYKFLNSVAEAVNKENDGAHDLLLRLYDLDVPEPHTEVAVYSKDLQSEFKSFSPDQSILPSIPENRNLTEYYNAVDVNNMVGVFASMLFERRIVFTSKKLAKLTACVHGAAALIYPMHWQHIFVPVLPKHLVDYLSAPMPFLIGVPDQVMQKVAAEMDMSGVVVLNADTNVLQLPEECQDDLHSFPTFIVSNLKKKLKGPGCGFGDGVARAFLVALVHIIGGYRDALRLKQGEKITFDYDAFLHTRPANIQPFLEEMLKLQIFQQFIEERLELLNSGEGFNDEFEYEVNIETDRKGGGGGVGHSITSQYRDWMGNMKKEGGALLKSVKSKANPAVRRVRERGKKAYKDMRSRLNKEHMHTSSSSLVPPSPASARTTAGTTQDGSRKTASEPSSPAAANFLKRERPPRPPAPHGGPLVVNLSTGDLPSTNHLTNITSASAEDEGSEALVASSDDEGDSGEDSDEGGEGYKRISMDLMEDLEDVIFRHRQQGGDVTQSSSHKINEQQSNHWQVGKQPPINAPPRPPPLQSRNNVEQNKSLAQRRSPQSQHSTAKLLQPIAPPRRRHMQPPAAAAGPDLIRLESLTDSSTSVLPVDVEFDPLKTDRASFLHNSVVTDLSSLSFASVHKPTATTDTPTLTTATTNNPASLHAKTLTPTRNESNATKTDPFANLLNLTQELPKPSWERFE